MDTKGHRAIAADAGEPKLQAALNSACQPGLRLGAFYFGNWLTDVSQSVDRVAFDGFEHKAEGFINEVCALAKHVCHEYIPPTERLIELPILINELTFLVPGHQPHNRPSIAVQIAIHGIEAMRNELLTAVKILFGDKKALEKTFQRTFEIIGYFKFVHPVEDPDGRGPASGRTIDFHAFMQIFKSKFTCYYPHEHIDRPEILGASSKGKPQYESSVDTSLGIYEYMRDDIEIAAGIFAQLDLKWAPVVFRPGPPIDDRNFEFNNNLAQLGHGLHLVEDFFAHSNFCEHAAQSLSGEFIAWKEIAKEAVFWKRLQQQFHPGWENEEGFIRAEPYVVTGFFDFKDTLVSLSHAAEELFGKHDPETAAGNYREMISQTLEIFTHWPNIDREWLEHNPLAVKLLGTQSIIWATPIEEEKVFPAILEEMGLSPQMAHELAHDFAEMVRLWTATKTAIHVGKDCWNLYKAFKTLCEFVEAPEIVLAKLLGEYATEKLGKKVIEILAAHIKNAISARFPGSQRLGCHSLLAKDTGKEVMADYAAQCARAVHGYVIKTLTRWAEPSDLCICRMPTSGSPLDHINTVDTRPWIDWKELLLFHLRHPVKATPDQRPPTVVETTVTHKCTGEETLEMLVLRYRKTGIRPLEPTVESVCEANARMHIPVNQYHCPPKGVVLVIPNQKGLIDHRDPLNRHRAWWRPIFEKKDWTSMEKRLPWYDEATRQIVEVSYHEWKPVYLEDVQKLAVDAFNKCKQLEAKYVPPVACVPAQSAVGVGG